MIRICIEVVDGSEHDSAPRNESFTVSVQAESLLAALGIASQRYPNGELRVIFPIDPEEFFVRDSIEAGPLALELSGGRT